MALGLMEHAGKDPADEIFKLVGMKRGKLDGYEIAGNRVLLGVYKRPEKTKSGIYIADTTRDEERNQGKACLVLAYGPTAFVSDSRYDFNGFKAEVGDWVTVHVYETRPVIVNGFPCRIAKGTDIVMKIPSPDAVY
jgi:co-chaperonin GroES (HSP10)